MIVISNFRQYSSLYFITQSSLSTSLNKFRELTSPADLHIYHAFGLMAQNALIESAKMRFPRVQRTRTLARS
jgi:hypothetical protein